MMSRTKVSGNMAGHLRARRTTMRTIPLLVMLMFAVASTSAGVASPFDDVETITIPATRQPIAQVTVFTDTSCPFCARLHDRRESLLNEGIEIRYVFYPRSGPGSASFRQAVSVWCSEDRLSALDLALHGETLPEADCDNPIAQHYAVARQLELLGTPAVITSDGVVRYGVVSAQSILGDTNINAGRSTSATLSSILEILQEERGHD